MKASGVYHVILIFLLIQGACKSDDELVTVACSEVLKDWEVTSVNIKSRIQKQNDIFFPSSKVGYSVGNSGSIMKTTNGGDNWEVLEYHYLSGMGYNPNSLTHARLLTCYFLDDNIGYIAGDGEDSFVNDIHTDAVFLSTLDGGLSWEKIYLGGVNQVYDLKYFSELQGLGLFLMNKSGLKLFRTNNAGYNWNEIPLSISRIKSLKFIDTETKTRIFGTDENEDNYLWTSVDRGVTWKKDAIPLGICNRIYFIDDDNGFANGGYTNFSTCDGGMSWQQAESPFNFYSIIHFNSVNNGFIINPIFEKVEGGGEITAVLQHYEVYETHDAGFNWIESIIDKKCNLEGISFSPDKSTFFTLGRKSNRFNYK